MVDSENNIISDASDKSKVEVFNGGQGTNVLPQNKNNNFKAIFKKIIPFLVVGIICFGAGFGLDRTIMNNRGNNFMKNRAGYGRYFQGNNFGNGQRNRNFPNGGQNNNPNNGQNNQGNVQKPQSFN